MLSEIRIAELAAGAVLLLCLLTGSYFKGRHDVESKDAPKFAAIAQHAKDEQAATDRTNIANNFVTKDAYNDLKTKLAGYGTSIDDLTQRLLDSSRKGSTVILPATMAATCKPADSGTARETEASIAGPAEPAPASSVIQTEVLRDDLTLALQNIEALEVVLDASAKVER